MSADEAREYFLLESSYHNYDLPKYFNFQPLLNGITEFLNEKTYDEIRASFTNEKSKKQKHHAGSFQGVNYTFIDNKNGSYAWRPFQLIHPVLYVLLVNLLTSEQHWKYLQHRFKIFQTNPQIECHSLPLQRVEQSQKAATIQRWWHNIEQRSVELGLEYEYLLHTDISHCYDSIYTHSIAWAISTKDSAKKDEAEKKLLGSKVDQFLQGMNNAQTNGIPQGSVLMDFIAELLLGYADYQLSIRLEEFKITEYKILRFRDDYRIFSNAPHTAKHIAKHLTEVLLQLSLRLGEHKTILSEDIITTAFKADKLFWLNNRQRYGSLQKQLLVLRNLGIKFKNCGTLVKELAKIYKRLQRIDQLPSDYKALVSISVDIAIHNPRTYPEIAGILSLLLIKVEEYERKELFNTLYQRFKTIPNIGYLQIWLQRIVTWDEKSEYFTEPLCRSVWNEDIEIWNSDWLIDEVKELMKTPIIDSVVLSEVGPVIMADEFDAFDIHSL